MAAYLDVVGMHRITPKSFSIPKPPQLTLFRPYSTKRHVIVEHDPQTDHKSPIAKLRN